MIDTIVFALGWVSLLVGALAMVALALWVSTALLDLILKHMNVHAEFLRWAGNRIAAKVRNKKGRRR